MKRTLFIYFFIITNVIKLFNYYLIKFNYFIFFIYKFAITSWLKISPVLQDTCSASVQILSRSPERGSAAVKYNRCVVAPIVKIILC